MISSHNVKRLPSPLGLSVCVHRTKDGPVLVRKTVGDADLWDYRSEAWHYHYLRQGQPDVRLDEVKFELSAVHEPGSTGRLSGFALAVSAGTDKRLTYEFTAQAVEHIAVEASRELVGAGLLREGEPYHYELWADNEPQSEPAVNPAIAIATTSAELQFLRFPIQRLLTQAIEHGPHEARMAHVFYTQHSLRLAEEYARRGGNQDPAIETGCILLGTHCSCPETGEFYVVVRDALEAVEAESKAFSLEYSGRTWMRLQAILRARQSRPEARADRFVGQAHGHPFLPSGGAPPCELCANRPDVTCARTSCFVSLDDSVWSRAVFSRQPWQLCHIFGLNARQEPVHKLYGLRNGQLLERGYSVIPEFQPEEGTIIEMHTAANLVAVPE